MDREYELEGLPLLRVKEEDFPQPLVKLEPVGIPLLLVTKEEVSHEQQGWSPSLDQHDTPELPHIQAEQQEFRTSQVGEMLQGLDWSDEERSWSLQLYNTQEMKTESDGEVCERTEPDRGIIPDSNLKIDTDDETSHTSESDTDDSCDWKETIDPQPSLNSLRNDEDPECNAEETPVSLPLCASSLDHKRHLLELSGIQTRVKRFCCSVCGKKYAWKRSLVAHMRLHSEGKCASCPVCKKSFLFKSYVVLHMRVHTGEKPFSCSTCSARFTFKGGLKEHMKVHSSEKPYSCMVCSANFARSTSLKEHLKSHTGEKPFRCSKCGKRFGQGGTLRVHMRIHTGEKPFKCSKCGKEFSQVGSMRTHMRIHRKEKPFRCSRCGRTFRHIGTLRTHMKIHMRGSL